MFVRWKRRKVTLPPKCPNKWAWEAKCKRRQQAGDLLSAYLMESVRIDGKPRQKPIAYLAAIREGGIKPGYGHPVWFWKSVTAKLDTLKLSRKVRKELEDRLAEVVPKPTKGAEAKISKILEKMGNTIRTAMGR